jgi:uncharacterized protein YbjT (DUF2867 family)
MELAVATLGFDAVAIARPSLLAGDRGSLMQAARPAEKMALWAFGLFKPFIPANYRSVEASEVAHALVKALKSARAGQHVLLPSELH